MLPAWISSCDIDDHTIFLDIKRNRYTAMNVSIASALISGDPSPVPARTLAQIEKWGWLSEIDKECQRPQRSIEMPSAEQSALIRDEPVGLRALVTAAASIVVTRYRLRTESLEVLLQGVAEANELARNTPIRLELNQAIASATIVERTLVGAQACLLRSLALHRSLAKHGHPSSLIFGVRLNPFRAHCWLQRGDTVLNDTVEQVGLFRPLREVA